jgi:hypothetical protein
LVCRGKAFAGVEKILGANQLGPPVVDFSVRNRYSKIQNPWHIIIAPSLQKVKVVGLLQLLL